MPIYYKMINNILENYKKLLAFYIKPYICKLVSKN